MRKGKIKRQELEELGHRDVSVLSEGELLMLKVKLHSLRARNAPDRYGNMNRWGALLGTGAFLILPIALVTMIRGRYFVGIPLCILFAAMLVSSFIVLKRHTDFMEDVRNVCDSKEQEIDRELLLRQQMSAAEQNQPSRLG